VRDSVEKMAGQCGGEEGWDPWGWCKDALLGRVRARKSKVRVRVTLSGGGNGDRQSGCQRAFGRKVKVTVGRCTQEGRQGGMAGEESARQQST